MKITALIELLQERLTEHGDINLAVSSEHYDQFDSEEIHASIVYKNKDDCDYGWEIACDGQDFDRLSDDDLFAFWNVEDRNQLEKMLLIS